MDASNPITRDLSLTDLVALTDPEPYAERATRADDDSPEPFNIVEVKDIWSDLEACRASAAWNFSSYLKQMRSLGCDKGTPEPTACRSCEISSLAHSFICQL